MNNRDGLLHQAKESIRLAKKAYDFEVSENFYKAAIANLLQLHPPENHLLADTYYRLSFKLFNNNKENKKRESAIYLEQAIQLIDQKNLKDDEDYRLLVLCNFVLSDTLSGLYQDGSGALQKSIKAFMKIKNKTKQEEELGNPNNNPEKFFEYYNKETCDLGYRKGTTFKINLRMLSEAKNNQVLHGFTHMTCDDSLDKQISL